MNKKIIPFALCIFLIIGSVLPIQAEKDSIPNDEKFHVVNVQKNGDYEELDSYATYPEAKVSHTLLKNKYNNLGITYGNSFLSIDKGVISFDVNDACSINTEYTLDQNDASGYTNGCYGNDAAFLEYNTASSKIKFKLSGVVGWVDAKLVSVYPIETIPSVSSFHVKNKILYHDLKSSTTQDSFGNSISLGLAPSYLKEDTTYYSYDSHYFYATFSTMIDDYRNDSYTNALNAKDVYYNYYQYLNHRSTSKYSPSDISKYLKDTLAFNQTITDFYDKDNYVHDILTQSLYMEGSDAFFQYQNQFGANALMMLSLSFNETAMGRSYLAYTRNNLFGHAAFDSAVEENASRYQSLSASVYSHALHYISNSYLNPKEFQFHGGFFGNKMGGMNVQYASDPYWGEKAAQYYYEIDAALGKRDENQYALGITNGKETTLYKDASTKSSVYYKIEKGYEGSFILLEKVKNEEGTWYRVQSEESLDQKGEQQSNGPYHFERSYAYINAKDIQSILNADKIGEKSYVDITFDAQGGTFYPDAKSVSLQVEKDVIPSITPPTKDHAEFKDWDIKLEKASNELTYKATYRDIKQITLSKSPKTNYNINDTLSLKGGLLNIEYSDGTNKEMALRSDMVSGFSSEKAGKQTLQITYANIPINLEITIGDTGAKKKNDVLERSAYIIKTYNGKTGLTSEALEEVNAFYKDVTSFDTNILKREEMRMIDRIFQENLEPRYSVVIKDDTYDMQVTGLSLALGGEKSFLQHFLPKTISMKIKDSVSGNDKSLAKKVAKANEVSIDGEFTISGTNDFSSLKLKQDVVFSIKKPKSTNDNKAYQVYYIKDEDVYQVPTTQSDSRILFSNDKLGSYVVVSRNVTKLDKVADFNEVNTIAANGKNYIRQYILLPLGIILLICSALLIYLIYIKRKKHTPIKQHMK